MSKQPILPVEFRNIDLTVWSRVFCTRRDCLIAGQRGHVWRHHDNGTINNVLASYSRGSYCCLGCKYELRLLLSSYVCSLVTGMRHAH